MKVDWVKGYGCCCFVVKANWVDYYGCCFRFVAVVV